MRASFPTSTRLSPMLISALLLAALADVLLFRSLGRPIGLPLPLFLAATASAAVLCNRRRSSRMAFTTGLFLAGAVLGLLESVSRLSVLAAFLCLAAFSLAIAGRLPPGLALVRPLLRFLTAVPFALLRDGKSVRRLRQRSHRLVRGRQVQALAWAVWIMPLALAGGFVLLLGAGNPIVGLWLDRIDLIALLDFPEPKRLGFWALTLVAVWPFLRPRIPMRRTAKPTAALRGPPAAATVRKTALREAIFSAGAILRALLLFNAVFAAETILDGVYLWGGATLPKGIGYAAYAHRGAYTLVATALLAAAFVLLALRPGAAAAGDRRIRWLVYLWIGQNVVLVLSAMLRLDLYVDAYSLTLWRVAAFLWMALVAFGLLLIVTRIALDLSNRWLVGMNLLAAAAMLYACCFVDFEAIVARFNVDHSREMTGRGAELDIRHLVVLGPAAVPAIDTLLDALSSRPGPLDAREFWKRLHLEEARRALLRERGGGETGWRQWTFRNWRLDRYLEAREETLARSRAAATPGPR